jgi:tyrosyl-tRNA synthetase
MLGQEEIANLVKAHAEAPHQRALQRKLAEEVTTMVHGEKELDLAVKASDILFGKSTEDDLKNLGVRTLLEIFSGVPQFEVKKELLSEGLDIINLLAEKTQVFSSKGEARKMLQANGVSLNKVKVNLEKKVTLADAISNQYLLAQKGKKNYYLLKLI